MKSKILIALAAVFVLGLAVAVYAFNQPTGNDAHSAMSNMENCPMKNKSAQAENHQAESCCDRADCCCKTGACPMRAQGEKPTGDCCGNCCGGACPMKNRPSETAAVQENKDSCRHDKKAGS